MKCETSIKNMKCETSIKNMKCETSIKNMKCEMYQLFLNTKIALQQYNVKRAL